MWLRRILANQNHCGINLKSVMLQEARSSHGASSEWVPAVCCRYRVCQHSRKRTRQNHSRILDSPGMCKVVFRSLDSLMGDSDTWNNLGGINSSPLVHPKYMQVFPWCFDVLINVFVIICRMKHWEENYWTSLDQPMQSESVLISICVCKNSICLKLDSHTKDHNSPVKVFGSKTSRSICSCIFYCKIYTKINTFLQTVFLLLT